MYLPNLNSTYLLGAPYFFVTVFDLRIEIMSNDHRVFFAKVEGPCTFAACCLAKK